MAAVIREKNRRPAEIIRERLDHWTLIVGPKFSAKEQSDQPVALLCHHANRVLPQLHLQAELPDPQAVRTQLPEPPADFVGRPAEFGALKQKLLNAKGDPVAIAAALKGAAGCGKTTLARALAHDPDIQDAYFDGVLWVEWARGPTVPARRTQHHPVDHDAAQRAYSLKAPSASGSIP
jgi:hypothetical protein